MKNVAKGTRACDPLVEGESGWAQMSGPNTKVTNGMHERFATLPTILRVYADRDPENFPKLSEYEAYQALRTLFPDDTTRKSVKVMTEPPDGKEATLRLLNYLKGNDKILKMWLRHKGQGAGDGRGDREMMGPILNGARIRRWEIAHMKIPKHLWYDEQVVFAQLRCQGVEEAYSQQLLGWTRQMGRETFPRLIQAESCLEGLEKFVRSPWVQFALAAPYMVMIGVDFGTSVSNSINRMRYLKKNPYKATSGELHVIFRSPNWQVAWAEATQKHGRVKASRTPPPTNNAFYNDVHSNPNRPLDRWFIFKRPGDRSHLARSAE